MTFTPTLPALCAAWTTGDAVREYGTWAFDIYDSSTTAETSIWRVEVEWTGTALLKTVALNSKAIWADYYGYPSIADLTFPYTNPDDLVIPPVIYTANPLRLTFSSNDFTIKHVKVYFENECYVQYYSNPYP